MLRRAASSQRQVYHHDARLTMSITAGHADRRYPQFINTADNIIDATCQLFHFEAERMRDQELFAYNAEYDIHATPYADSAASCLILHGGARDIKVL